MGLGIAVSLVVVTLLLFILVLSLYARHFADRDARILQEVARKYGGTISVDSFSTSAAMDFPLRGATVRFYQRKGMGGKTTRCCLRCNVDYSTSLSMHIAKGITGETSIGELQYLLFMPKVDVGSERFSKEFVVRGNNQSFLHALLAGDFEKQLLAFRTSDPVLYLHPKNETVNRLKGESESNHLVEFSINHAPRRKEELEKLIDEGVSVVRRFLGGSAVR